MSSKTGFILLIIFCLILFFLIAILFKYFIFPELEPNVKTGIIGAFTGALFVFVGTIITNLFTAWAGSREISEKLKDRVSNHAIELTKLHFELRQKSLEITNSQKNVLAPAKVYREFYKALLELHEKGTWPKAIQKLGLLSIFKLGTKKTDD